LRNSPLKTEVAAVSSRSTNTSSRISAAKLLVCLIDGTLIGTALYFYRTELRAAHRTSCRDPDDDSYIGIILCWVPAVLIAAGQWGDWYHPILVTVVFLLVQNLEAVLIDRRSWEIPSAFIR